MKYFYEPMDTFVIMVFISFWRMNRLEAWKKIDNLARANPDIHKLTSLMKECTFMEIEDVDNVNAVSNETTDNDKIIMNNINNLMAVDDNDDR